MFREDLLDSAINKYKQRRIKHNQAVRLQDAPSSLPVSLRKLQPVRNKSLSYTERFRGSWFRPEYDFDELLIAQDTDSYVARSISKKVNKLICAGFEFTGQNPEAVKYIQRRFDEFAMVTGVPLQILMSQLYNDIFRTNNCIMVKVRNAKASSGKVRKDFNGRTIQPIAGLFILPLETLQFKTKPNGDLKKILQRMPTGAMKEFSPRDIVHFFLNKRPGFAVGTPELWPALDDIQLLRRLEENVEELIETNLFPVYHYKIGTDSMPERITPEGIRESDIIRRTVEYTPSAGVYVSDHRHEIQVIGSEGNALRIDFYLNYFKSRVFAALGTSSVDMGESNTSNRSTASTLSKGMLMDVEAVALTIKAFFDFYIINELLLEGGYDPLNPEDRVEIKFGVIDKEERRAQENHLIQSFHGNVRDIDEVRKLMGEKPFEDEQLDRTHYKMFQEPLALIKSVGPGFVAEEVLADIPVSNIEKKNVKSPPQENESTGRRTGRPPNPLGTGSARAAANRNQPSNQHGTRPTAKTNIDYDNNQTLISLTCGDTTVDYLIDKAISPEEVANWYESVLDRYVNFNFEVSIHSIAETMLHRIG